MCVLSWWCVVDQGKWGETATREIMDRFYTFLSGITIMCGQIKGQTRLPMPPVDLSGTKSSGKNRSVSGSGDDDGAAAAAAMGPVWWGS